MKTHERFLSDYFVEEWYSYLSNSYRDVQNQCQRALQLFWWLVMSQQLTKTFFFLICFFNLSPICIYSCHDTRYQFALSTIQNSGNSDDNFSTPLNPHLSPAIIPAGINFPDFLNLIPITTARAPEAAREMENDIQNEKVTAIKIVFQHKYIILINYNLGTHQVRSICLVGQ